MGTGAVTRAWLVAIAMAPWLTLLPIDGPFAVLTQALVVVAAFHGAGLVVAQLARRAIHPLLAVQVGIAALIALGGLATALGRFTLATQVIALYGFAAVHTAAIGLRFATYRESLASLRPSRRSWLVPALLLAALASFHILGAAGDLGARPFDDDGHVLAQLQRLRETGALADAIGYPRAAQLGGQLVLDAIATVATDVHAFRIAEAIAFVLALGLAFSRAKPHDTTTGLWILLVVLGAVAFTFVPDDPATAWTAVGLILALHALVADDLPALLIGLVAGALVTLRFELAPIAGAAVVAAWWPQRSAHRRTLWLVIGMLAVVLPFAIARIAAWSSIPEPAHALLLPARGPTVARLAIATVIAIPAIGLVLAVVADRGLRWLFIAAVLAASGIVAQLTGDRPYAIRFLWPIGVACVLVVAIEVVRGKKLAVAALLISLAIAVVVTEAQIATGRFRWTRRSVDITEHVEYLRHASDAPITGGYSALLDRVPAGFTVAIWIARPERLDYTRHRIIDLRSPRAAHLRSRLTKLAVAVEAAYLLVETDYRRDDLEPLVALGRVVATAPGLQLVAL